MPYALDYTSGAEDQLADYWTSAANRNAVTRAANRIDSVLAANPFQGTHRSEGLYWLRVAPLIVFYEIDSAAAIVTVTAVGLG